MKKTRTAPIDPVDRCLFHAAVSDVIPLRRKPKVEHERQRPEPIPAQRLRDDRETLRESLSDQVPWDSGLETGEELSYTRNGIGVQTLKRLRRGYWVIQAELDLHGLIVDEARGLLADFLNGCLRRGVRCVRIIHGKGLRSKNREPVLKRKVAGWLMQRDEILAFCQAPRTDGGSGAVVVLLAART
jgi:DNA-nicking Smr family endonuclease